MGFTYNPVPLLKPEQQNPMGNMIQNAMKMHMQNVQAQYARPQQEADIFAKKMTPISALAASPYFNAMNDKQREQITAMMSKLFEEQNGGNGESGAQGGGGPMDWLKHFLHIGGQNGSSNGQQEDTNKPYDPNAKPENALQKSIEEDNRRKAQQATAESYKNKLTEEQIAQGGISQQNGQTILNPASSREEFEKASVGLPRLDKITDGLIADLEKIGKGNKISDYISSAGLAAEGAHFPLLQAAVPQAVRQKQQDLASVLIKNFDYSPEQADAATQKGIRETSGEFATRLKTLAKDLSNRTSQLKNVVKNKISLEKNAPQEEHDMNFSKQLSQDIKTKIGKDIPDTVIFNYLSQHPGKVHIPSLLKAAGMR